MRSVESQQQDRSRPLSAPVELRIHGVGGAAPEILLGHPHPVQVAGDDTAGFYRSSRTDGPPERRALEAYSWGGITSRSGSRALWLLVLPFALANAAGFMLERGETARVRFARILLRALALSVTVLFVLWAGGLALDLLAFQCGGDPTCTGRHWWLTFFEHPFLQYHPTRRVALAVTAPALLIFALRRATTFTRTRYEDAFSMEPVEEPDRTGADPAGAGLGEPVFWHSSRFGERLLAAHISAAAAALAGASAYACWQLLAAAGIDDRVNLALMIASAVVGGTATISVMLAARGPVRWLAGLGWWLVGLVMAVNLIRSIPGPTIAAALPGYSRAVLMTGLVSLILAVVLMFTLAGHRMIPPVATTSVGVFAMGSFLAGSHVRLADWLGNRVMTADQPQIVYSPAYDWFSLAALAAVAAAAIAALLALLWLRGRGSSVANLATINARYGDPAVQRERRSWLGRIARAEAVSELVDDSEALLTVLLSMVVGGSIGFYWIRTFGTGSPLGPIGLVPAGWRSLIPAATWVSSVLPLVALAVIYRSFRNPGTRRRVGIIWDIVTFWPRWYHPLAPPPYSARAVPELGVRLARLVNEGAAVTLSAHSQGSILAAASVARLPAGIRGSLRLLTHGSPLRRLYGRFFPAYFGTPLVEQIRARLEGRWLNLFRPTDPIGGPVGSEGVDRTCRDPETDRREPGDPLPRVQGHAFYAGTTAYDEALADLENR
ncbi:MAG TPA: hypothetical protein VLA54_04780 [Acidimicrobiia bacterium]|nr:hypothetical protein [Acidimicrobiia bacterium]